jgi:hypothetical protein
MTSLALRRGEPTDLSLQDAAVGMAPDGAATVGSAGQTDKPLRGEVKPPPIEED